MSYSDEEENIDPFDPYESDHRFTTQEELDVFMAGCDLSKVRNLDEETFDCDNFRKIKKICSCGECEDIWSDDFEHVCCHQTGR